MSERWGSQWKWRWSLAAVLAGLLAYATYLAEQWLARRLIPSHSSPAVLRVTGRWSDSLDAFDWKASRRFKIANLTPKTRSGETDETIEVVLDGAAVGWQRGKHLHLVDVQPPHREQVFAIPLDTSRHKFIGMSADARYAVFQASAYLQLGVDGIATVVSTPQSGASGRTIYILTVIDLVTEQVADTRQWESSINPAWRSGEFASGRAAQPPPLDSNEPLYASWSISADGKWTRIDHGEPQSDTHIFAAKDQSGGWRLLVDGPTDKNDSRVVQLEAVHSSPSGKRLLAYQSPKPSTVIVDQESRAIRPLETFGQFFTAAEFVDDETLVLSDLRDDIRVIDPKSGKLIAVESSGSQRRARLVVVAIGAALTAAGWLVVAFRERVLVWGLVDSLTICVSAQLALVTLLIASHHSQLGSISTSMQAPTFAVYCFVAASNVGTATIVGWYWSHGRGWVLTRWLFGLTWLSISALPLGITVGFVDTSADAPTVYAATIAFSILLGGLTSFIVAGVRSMGWTIYTSPLQEDASRFGLASCFAVLTGIAILIPIGQWFFKDTSNNDGFLLSAMGVGAAGVGIVLVANLFSLARWQVQAVTWGLVTIAAVLGVVLLERRLSGLLPGWLLFTLESSAAVAVILAITVPCLVLRSHGWHWIRLEKAAASPAPARVSP